jgi:hypothetical protein
MSATAERELDDYLAAVQAGLRAFPPSLAEEIIRELRGHVNECAEIEGRLTEDGVAAALERLGPPGALAAVYVAECGGRSREHELRSPNRKVRNLAGWVAASPAGTFLVLGSFLGYFFAAALTLCSIRKIFAPDRAGLWSQSDGLSIHLGFGTAPPDGTELLGWSIVPLGLLTGISLLFLTVRLGIGLGRALQRPDPMPPH